MQSQKEYFSSIVYNVISQAEMGEAYPISVGSADFDIEYNGFTIVIVNNAEKDYYAYEYDARGQHDLFKIQCPETDKLIKTFAKNIDDDGWGVCIIMIPEEVDDTVVDFIYDEDSTPWSKPLLELGAFVNPSENLDKDEAWMHNVSNAYMSTLPKSQKIVKENHHKQERIQKEVRKREIVKDVNKIGWFQRLNQPIELPSKKSKPTDLIVTAEVTNTPVTKPAEKVNDTANLATSSIPVTKPKQDSSPKTGKNDIIKVLTTPIVLRKPVMTPVAEVKVEAGIVYDDYPDEDYRLSSRMKAEEEQATLVEEAKIVEYIQEISPEEVKLDEDVSVSTVDTLIEVAHQSNIELINKHEPYKSVSLIICLTPPIVTTYGFWYNDANDNDKQHGYWTPESKALDDAIDAFIVDTIPDPKKYWDVCVIKIQYRGAKPTKEFFYGEEAKPWLETLSNRSKIILGLAKP